MFQRIIVPVDGSQLAERATPYAIELGELAKAPITLVRVVDTVHLAPAVGAGSPWIPAPDIDLVAEVEVARSYVNALAGDLRARGLSADALVETGPTVDSILHVAQPGDVVVISSHG